MFNSRMPGPDELPTAEQLLRSTLIALGVAGVLLVAVVLPAEFAVDPTGVGRLLGLQQMGELKAALARETKDVQEAGAASGSSGTATSAATESSTSRVAADSSQQHEMTLTLDPNQGAEVKLVMREGARVQYEWKVSGGTVNFDAHGDPHQAPRGFYHGYGKGKGVAEHKGELIAAFDGRHGWFLRNRESSPVTVVLRTKGEYQSIKRVL